MRQLAPLAAALAVAAPGVASLSFTEPPESGSVVLPQATPSRRLSTCRGTITTTVSPNEVESCDTATVAGQAEAVCSTCPGGINVVFIEMNQTIERDWMVDTAYEVFDQLLDYQRVDELDVPIKLGVVHYNFMWGKTMLELTENIVSARHWIEFVGPGNVRLYEGRFDLAASQALRMLQDERRRAGLGDEDQRCEYVVAFALGSEDFPEAGARMLGGARSLIRQGITLMVGCPEESAFGCYYPRLMQPDRRLYTEAPARGRFRGVTAQELRAYVDPQLLREVRISHVISPGLTYLSGSAAPTPASVITSPEGTALEWVWPRVAANGPHTVTYRIVPEDLGAWGVGGSLGIWDADGRRRQVLAPSARITVTDECPMPPTATATRTATPPPTQPPTGTPRPTRAPRPLFLPIVHREQCRPELLTRDVALVIDASTSMRANTRTGRSKLEAAREAASSFVDTLRLEAGDQAAIVAFNSQATVVQDLTADRAALRRALQQIVTAPQTCLVCGVVAGADELASPRHRAGQLAVLILLTDGRSNPRPAREAVDRAAIAKAAGVLVFTIGLGEDLDTAALAAMASQPEYFFRAPDAEDLADIYAAIPSSLPCPPEEFWPRRR